MMKLYSLMLIALITLLGLMQSLPARELTGADALDALGSYIAEIEAQESRQDSSTDRALQKAYNAWRNGELSRAVRLYEDACYDDNMGACHALGTLYFQGSGVAQNYSMSASYYYKACMGGFSPACNSLGILHHFGLGVRQDYSLALNLYAQSCKSGYGRACNNVGVMFEEGLGVKKNYKQAGLYYADSCLVRDDRACFNLAELLSKGKGMKKDKQKAMEYYGLSCDFGLQEGCEMYRAFKLKEEK
ncbi:MAG: sel1 repeat family protein [Helicobacter sp.]|uniref:tetratricopeptide repeat protein n=1 Tax=Helicobacter sp. TaxID=218 RepID=UPI0025BD3A30|nr:tetratricopeptide repeat protein [Helicobacter sp.]MCH5312908.1 sel1 repeat family protein [Helicobacter sp.]